MRLATKPKSKSIIITVNFCLSLVIRSVSGGGQSAIFQKVRLSLFAKVLQIGKVAPFKRSKFDPHQKHSLRWWQILLNDLQKTKSRENSSLLALFRNSVATTPTFVKKRNSQCQTKLIQIEKMSTKWRSKIADWSLDYLTVLKCTPLKIINAAELTSMK